MFADKPSTLCLLVDDTFATIVDLFYFTFKHRIERFRLVLRVN